MDHEWYNSIMKRREFLEAAGAGFTSALLFEIGKNPVADLLSGSSEIFPKNEYVTPEVLSSNRTILKIIEQSRDFPESFITYDSQGELDARIKDPDAIRAISKLKIKSLDLHNIQTRSFGQPRTDIQIQLNYAEGVYMDRPFHKNSEPAYILAYDFNFLNKNQHQVGKISIFPSYSFEWKNSANSDNQLRQTVDSQSFDFRMSLDEISGMDLVLILNHGTTGETGERAQLLPVRFSAIGVKPVLPNRT